MRYLVSAGFALALMVGSVVAGEEQASFRLTRGKVTKTSDSTVNVSGGGSYQSVDSTKINIDGKSKLSDLREGEEITIIYNRKNDSNMIREVNTLQVFTGKLISTENGKMNFEPLNKEENQKTWTFNTATSTKVSIGGNANKEGTVKDLRVGDTCCVAYDRGNTARFIERNPKMSNTP